MPPKCVKTREPKDEQLCKLSAPYRKIKHIYIDFRVHLGHLELFLTLKPNVFLLNYINDTNT